MYLWTCVDSAALQIANPQITNQQIANPQNATFAEGPHV
jgi:hypothetical protein